MSRILKKIINTKTAVELMLLHDGKGRTKAEKRLFPVCSAIEELSNSSSEEEKLLCVAYEQAAKQDAERAVFYSSRIASTRRGLLESFKTNEAGEAIYDSERGHNIMDQVTDSQMSLVGKGSSSPGRSNRTFSKGSRRSSKRRGKKSYASIVLEEPSKEDRGFAF